MKIKKFLQISFLTVAILLVGTFSIAKADDNTSAPPSDPTPTDPTPASTPTPVPPVTIHLNITTNSGSLYSKDITVTACNSDHNTTTNVNTTAYCAILQSGLQSDWNWKWPPGAFLNSLDNIAGSTTEDANNNPVYHYWSWTLQRDPTISDVQGLNEYNLQPNDVILLNFIDPVDSTPTPTPVITSSGGKTSSGGYSVKSNTTISATKPTFDIKKSLDFLASEQKADGSFGEDIYTDWASIAFASNPNYQDQKTKLIAYFSENKFSGTNVTDYERHAMALMSLNLNPYNTNNENYIQDIISNYDGKQFGDVMEDNDDIFALIVLQNTGYTQNDDMISNTINFILSRQETDGSWDESVDMTGAGIEALSAFKESTPVENALTKAESFLKQKQQDTGGWANVSSTAWALEGISGLGEKQESWIKNNNIPSDYFVANQDTDGGVKDADINSKIWETSYVTSSLSGETWNQIMQKFGKMDIPTPVKTTKNPTPIKIKEIKKTLIQKNIQKNNSTNTATALSAVTAIPTSTTQIEHPKKNWFLRLLDSIF